MNVLRGGFVMRGARKEKPAATHDSESDVEFDDLADDHGRLPFDEVDETDQAEHVGQHGAGPR